MEVILMTIKPKPLPPPPGVVRIDTYRVFHYSSGKSDIRVWGWENSVRKTYVWTNVDPLRALLMVDLLRNENMDYVHMGDGKLEVSAEPVGAGDEEWQT